MKVLIIENDFVSRHYMRDLLRYYGYSCQTAMNASEGLDLYINDRPDVIICNVFLPGISGFEFLSDIRQKDNKTFVIMISSKSSEKIAVQAFRIGANEYLRKPLQDKDILPILSNISTKIDTSDEEIEKYGTIEEGRLKLVFPTEFDSSHLIVDNLMHELDKDFFNESDRVGIELGLSELITNAIEHGNLNISYQEKSQMLDDGNALLDLYRKRLLDINFASRMVTVYFEYDKMECKWTIIDEGNGFDFNNVPDPTKEENMCELHGRGIMFSKCVFDSVNYIGKGNEVVVTKKRKFLI